MGLGRMGGNLARQALKKGVRVVGFVRHDAPADLAEAGLEVIQSVAEFRDRLSAPRVVFLYIITQSIMQFLASRDARRIAPRAIAAMRHGFGGHPFGTDDSVKKERGRVGELFAPV